MNNVCLFVFVVFCLVILDASRTRFRCDYKYSEKLRMFFKYHEMPATWHDAQLRCHLEGAVIASPLYEAVKLAMLSFMSTTHNYRIFTGIHSTLSKTVFVSMEGVPLSNIPHTWTRGEPMNTKNNQDCIFMKTDGSFGQIDCQDTLPFICYKKDLPDKAHMLPCGTIDPEYKLGDTGSCYKVHQTPRIWSRAYLTCVAEGGYLAVINSPAEKKVLQDLYYKYYNPVAVGDYFRDAAHIGFLDWNEHGEWRTIFGQTLQDAGYANFQGGQPDNFTPGEFCGSMFRTGPGLNDIWCTKRALFICEKDPESLVCKDGETDTLTF